MGNGAVTIGARSIVTGVVYCRGALILAANVQIFGTNSAPTCPSTAAIAPTGVVAAIVAAAVVTSTTRESSSPYPRPSALTPPRRRFCSIARKRCLPHCVLRCLCHLRSLLPRLRRKRRCLPWIHARDNERGRRPHHWYFWSVPILREPQRISR